MPPNSGKIKLFIFNPTCEMAIANGTISWSANKHLQQFEKDLEYLPLLFTSGNDLLAVHRYPSAIFNEWLNKTVKLKPKLIDRAHLTADIEKNGSFPDELHPWGWSPAMHNELKDLKSYTSADFKKSPSSQWKGESKSFYGRSTALELLKTIVAQYPHDRFLPYRYHPEVANSTEAVEKLFEKWPKLVLKAPWSASGRGIQILRYGYLNTSNRQWINSVLKQQGHIMVEPLLNKTMDFSLHFHIYRNHIQYVGYGEFKTNKNGQYEQNIIKPNIKNSHSSAWIETLAKKIKEALLINGIDKRYEGYAGVDLMHVKINDESYIHPFVEVNWRYNMGLIALQLEQFIHSEAGGSFHIHINPQKPFSEIHNQLVNDYPLILQNDLPLAGYFPLSDPDKAVSGAYVILTPNR